MVVLAKSQAITIFIVPGSDRLLTTYNNVKTFSGSAEVTGKAQAECWSGPWPAF